MIKKCVIFDFEGTLINTIPLYIENYNIIAKKLGFNLVTKDFICSFEGSCLNKFIKILKIPKIIAPLILIYLRKKVYNDISKINFIDEIKKEIIKFKENNYTLGIISTSRKSYISKYLLFENANYFDFIETSYFIYGKDKTIRKIKKLYKDHKLLYVGDEVRDILASKKCNIPCASVSWGAQSKKVLLKENPDLLIENPSNIFRDIENFFKIYGG